MSGDQTPVLVTPAEFTFKPAFFAELARQLKSRVKNPIDIDLVREPGTPLEWLGHWQLKRVATKATRMINASGVRVDCAAMLRRPQSKTLVVGCCDCGTALPPWAAKIELIR
ncbi:hypothetical protein Pla22_32940 [Rubripirellula amarantea]|uniref:Uncharacterized protein n=2 Tax=Rubripirellula amarantea TaxID=2527999 RepID=A0A5C5WKJ7_9BACT|nr:hypothetical protein Pla22_32940 [Rubripirellula amarantea]